MEFKFRRKGEVVTMEVPLQKHILATDLDFNSSRRGDIPKNICPPEEFEGIDLTGYSVIYSTFGRHGHDLAQSLHESVPNCIVLYQYNWRNGWGEGILLPENFNASKVKFYKSKQQIKIETERKRLAQYQGLYQEIKKAFPDYNLSSDVINNEVVYIMPRQEAFSLGYGWRVRASSIEEALAGIDLKTPMWKEWNERALEVYLRLSGKPNPGNGNIDIHPSPFGNCKEIGVELDLNTSKWVWFHKQEDGSWKEGTIHDRSPLEY